MELKICHLYPDVLNLYGDNGNIICMCNRLRWRGIQTQVTALPIGESCSLKDFDLFFLRTEMILSGKYQIMELV